MLVYHKVLPQIMKPDLLGVNSLSHATELLLALHVACCQCLDTAPSLCPPAVVGCAFVTFCKRESAEKAMEQLHDKATLPGVSACVHVFVRPYALCITQHMTVCGTYMYMSDTRMHSNIHPCD